MLPVIRRRTGSYIPSLFDEWSSLLDNFTRVADATFEGGSEFRAAPIELREYPDRYLVLMDVPGVKREDIEISLENGSLAVKVSRPEAEEEKDVRVLHGGRWYGTTSRTISLPFAAADEDVDAKLTDGVLRVEIKKQPEKQTKRITIN